MINKGIIILMFLIPFGWGGYYVMENYGGKFSAEVRAVERMEELRNE